MKEIKAMTQKISVCSGEIERIEAEIARLDALAAAADGAGEELSALRRSRADEVARAFIEQRAPQTSQIDKEIGAAEKAGEKTRIDAESSKVSATVLRERVEGLRLELENLRLQRRGAAIAELQRVRDDALDEYVAAVNAVGPIVARLQAVDTLIRQVNPSPALPRLLPGEEVFVRIQNERLPIPKSRTNRPGPYVREGLYVEAPDFERGYALCRQYAPCLPGPDWMEGSVLQGAVNAEVESGSEKLRAVGVEL
ncbi:hypothetical protein [Ralstonia solanacearum]|uniref:hypothetical protein n=1 Tax=Ralstonia solanacearum TaxID=305 RepID=UPI0004FFB6CC|nr:hypothetical protein [Ralstonia solanacearum]KFX30174.1 hypothetical protein KR96_03750 [Ralstonia solanacearum]KFX81377.1 hypothetical protein KR99_23665 [Ralstonia solanacearum]